MNTKLHAICSTLLLSFAASSLTLRADDAATGPVSRLEEFEVRAPRASALTQAPTEANPAAKQPQSGISLEYIANNMSPTADYATIANIAPSTANIETNGPGLSEAKHTTIRGFDDGSYNVTFDGIPFGDYNTFTHHTTSYFPAKLLGRVVVDRGPGTASTIGNATFGGTLALLSKDPRSVMNFVPTLSTGSWGTRLGHFEVNTGVLPRLEGASAIASYQRMETDGFRTNADMKRDTYYLKYLQPAGKDTTLTLLSSYNVIHFGNPGTVTQQQIDLFGRNFGLKDNTAANHLDPLNRRYNYQDKKADFEYAGLDHAFGGGWRLEDKLYTYSYENVSHEKPKAGTGTAAGTMLGSVKLNEYRTYGDTLTLSHADAAGTFKTGLWYDTTTNHRHTYGVNYDTTGADAIDLTATALYKAAAPGGNPLTLPGASAYNYKYLLVDKDTTLQLFAEYDWHPFENFSINGGVRYQQFTRDFNADVNQTSARQQLIAKRTDRQATPSIAVNWTIAPDWSAYAQLAQGFQAPSEANSFYVNNRNFGAINIQPEISTNYQVGTVYRTERFNAGASAYLIDFRNYAYNGPADSTGDPSYYGIASGAYYRGVEFEATYLLGGGLSLYGNGSLNSAQFKHSKLDLPTVPENTYAAGFVYDSHGFFASLVDKHVGSWVVYDTLTNPDLQGGGATRSAASDGYWIADLALGYSRKLSARFLKGIKVRVEVGNLFNRKVQVLDSIGASASSTYTTDAYNVLPGRNYFVTAALEF